MTDSNNAAVGRTRWRRFAAVMGGATVVAGALVFGVANGAIAASFNISGEQFKVSASELDGQGFAQFGGYETVAKDGSKIPVATSVIKSATLKNMCQSVDASSPLFPGLKIVLRIEAGKSTPASATNLVIGMTELSGNATFTNINIGADGGEVSGSKLLTGTFAQNAAGVKITDLEQKAYSTTAGTFALNGLSMKVLTGDDAVECFED
ncbi:DUF6230 family protein [Luedemannella flava]|uniref:DUF6230 family protein n=1 Tax=Luedemannella flava TaxID=349316 RepID=A0ABP4Y4S3_9ACTN